MTDQKKPTVDELLSDREAAEDNLRATLLQHGYDGPFPFVRGGFELGAWLFGGVRDTFAVCLKCGAMVVLNDLRCVWCHAVTCGNADQDDPCIEPYHHRVPHRSRMGLVWPIGGDRPKPVAR